MAGYKKIKEDVNYFFMNSVDKKYLLCNNKAEKMKILFSLCPVKKTSCESRKENYVYQ